MWQSFLSQSCGSRFVEMFLKNSVCLMLRRACSCLINWRNCSKILHPYESASPVLLPREVRPVVSCRVSDGHMNQKSLGTDPSLPQFSPRCENITWKILSSIQSFQPDLPLLDTIMGRVPSGVRETKIMSLNTLSSRFYHFKINQEPREKLLPTAVCWVLYQHLSPIPAAGRAEKPRVFLAALAYILIILTRYCCYSQLSFEFCPASLLVAFPTPAWRSLCVLRHFSFHPEEQG